MRDPPNHPNMFGKILLKWMIWGYPYFRNPAPYGYFEIAMENGPLIDDKYDDVP